MRVKSHAFLAKKWAGWLSRGHFGGGGGGTGGFGFGGFVGESANVCQAVKTIANGLLGGEGEQSQLSSPPPSDSPESLADIWQSELESSSRFPVADPPHHPPVPRLI